MAKQRRDKAPLFNSEHLLSKPIPELVCSGINLLIQLYASDRAIKHVMIDQK
jgi:hypothetical protein